eukprot:UN04403
MRCKVVGISSVVGHVSMTPYCLYAASKHAVEALYDALRQELYYQDIDVVLIEPGGVQTNFIQTLTTQNNTLQMLQAAKSGKDSTKDVQQSENIVDDDNDKKEVSSSSSSPLLLTEQDNTTKHKETHVVEYYKDILTTIEQVVTGADALCTPVNIAAEMYLFVLTSSRPLPRYVIGRDAHLMINSLYWGQQHITDLVYRFVIKPLQKYQEKQIKQN